MVSYSVNPERAQVESTYSVIVRSQPHKIMTLQNHVVHDSCTNFNIDEFIYFNLSLTPAL